MLSLDRWKAGVLSRSAYIFIGLPYCGGEAVRNKHEVLRPNMLHSQVLGPGCVVGVGVEEKPGDCHP